MRYFVSREEELTVELWPRMAGVASQRRDLCWADFQQVQGRRGVFQVAEAARGGRDANECGGGARREQKVWHTRLGGEGAEARLERALVLAC